jgi:serine/threonine protein phosphatase 1
VRILAIGDIHGYLRPLRALIDTIAPQRNDLLIFLGDYVDKGPDVKGVIDYLIAVSKTHNTVFLRGNHDQMMIDAYREPAKSAIWSCLAGEQPLASYGDGTSVDLLKKVPGEHWTFLETGCRNYYETSEFIFVHGGIRFDVTPTEEEPERLQWMTLSLAEPHNSGRTVICGHSRQPSGKITDLGHTICVDTGITHGGWLSCLALDTFEYWQADADGQVRTGQLPSRSS